MYNKKFKLSLFCRLNGSSRLEQYVEVLKEMHKTGVKEHVKQRLQSLVSILVNQNIEQRDSLEGQYSLHINMIFANILSLN